MKRSEVYGANNISPSLLNFDNTEYRPLNLPIVLVGGNRIPQACVAFSVSLSRILLLPESISIIPGEIVGLEFNLRYDGYLKHCQIPGRAAEIGKHALAIDFHQFNNETFGYIRKLMFDTDLRVLREVSPAQERAA